MYLPNTFTFFFCSRLVASILLPYPNNQNVSDEAIAFVVEEKNFVKLILAVEDTNFLKILEFIHRLFNFRVNIHNDLSFYIYLVYERTWYTSATLLRNTYSDAHRNARITEHTTTFITLVNYYVPHTTFMIDHESSSFWM